MVGWHHQLNGHEFEQALEDGEGQGSLAGCSPWGHKELETTERLNNNNKCAGTHAEFNIFNFHYKRISESRSVVSESLRPHRLYSPLNSPGQNTGMCSLSLLQGIFLTQGSNPGLLSCRWIRYQLNHKRSP